MSDLVPALRRSIGIVENNKRLQQLADTLIIEAAHLRIENARLRAQVARRDFDLSCDDVSMFHRKQAE